MSFPVNQFPSLRRQIRYSAVTGQAAQSRQTVLSQAGLMKDRVQFGAALSPSPEMPFVQKKDISTAGTKNTPISPNNCIVCSAKNLLAYYGYDQETINNVIQGGLAEEINNPRHFEADSPYFPFQNNRDTIELNNNFVREYLSHSGWGFNMNIQPYRIGDKANIEQAIHESKPLWVFAEHDTHTLAGKALSEGHAYLVAPDRNDKGKWLVLDSWNGVTQLNAEQLKHNLGTMTSQFSQYNVIQSAPDPDLMNVYKPGSIRTQHPLRPSQIRTELPTETPSESMEEPKPAEELSEAPEIVSPIETPSESVEDPKPVEESSEAPEIVSPIETPSESVEEPKPVEESSELSEITTPTETPSETVEEPKPAEESSEVSEITTPPETPSESVEEAKPVEDSSEVTTPIKTPSETAETPKPSSVQESKTEADSKQSKRSWTQRLGQWFKDTWNSFTQNLKRFGNWVKSIFSSKKKAD